MSSFDSAKEIHVTVKHRFRASAERVFDAFLDPAKASKFLFATPTGEMVRVEIDAVIGGRYTIVERRNGEDVAHTGEYLEIDRPKRLVFTLRVEKYSQDSSRVEIDIVPLEGGCELTLTHWMSPHYKAHRDNVQRGWAGIVAGVEQLLEAETAADTDGLYVLQSIEIAASAATVWRILTDSELSKSWIHLWWPDVTLQSDWNVNSEVLWKEPDDQIGAQGSVLAADFPHTLAFTFRVNVPGLDKQEIITYRLEEHDAKTRLSVSVGDFSDSPEHQLCYPGAVEAWTLSMPQIKMLSEAFSP